MRSVFVADKEVAKEHAQWRHSEMKEEIDAQARQDPLRPFLRVAEISVICAVY